MLQHFRDNSLDPNAHLLIHGVVDAKEVTARFPKLSAPSDDWGAVANVDGPFADRAEFEEGRCVALTTLLKQLPPVDLIHCDVRARSARCNGRPHCLASTRPTRGRRNALMTDRG